jgi:uncharacterized protein (TIGR00255 family)
MTGFSYVEYKDNNRELSLEIKSYNNRYLDIYVNLPSVLSTLEPDIRDYMKSFVDRGKVEVYLRYRELEEDLTVSINRDNAKKIVRELEEVKRNSGIRGRTTLSDLLRLEGIVRTEHRVDMEAMRPIIERLIEDGCREFDTSRREEGRKTGEDIAVNVAVIEQGVAVIQKRSSELEEKIKENLITRFNQLLGDGVDENRVYAEIAVMLVRYSIGEELQRMSSHLDRFKEIMHKNNGIGKKLDFLCQELNREINTIGSKSIILEINQTVVDIKDAIEKVREQLRNIE